MTTISDILELSYGKALKESDRDGGDVPVVGSGGVVGGHSAGITDAPTIVVGRKGSIGSVTWVDGPAWPIDTAYFVKPKREDLDRRWAYWMLRSLRMETMNKSAAVPGLNRDDVYRLNVTLPPLPEQRRIAAILDHADALRAKRRQILTNLDSLTQSIFTDMFAEGDYPSIRASTLMPHMRNGLSPATAGSHEAQVLTLSSVTRGSFEPSAVKSGVFAIEPPADKRVTDRDFLMCRGNGNKALVGVGTYSRENRSDLVFPDTVIAGAVDTTLVTLSFLEAAWKQKATRSQIEAVARTTNGTYKVNQKTLGRVILAVPPLDLQEAFGTRTARIGAQQSVVLRASRSDDELFASLQSRAFRGEL
ncbi:restriction endonuclease subunit S [Propionibacteriaceae bacterium Y2011]